MIIKGIEYKKIVSVCTKCGYISSTTYLEPKGHYAQRSDSLGSTYCGDFELYVEVDRKKEQEMISSDFY